MNNEQRMYKLKNGTETAIWAHDRIIELEKIVLAVAHVGVDFGYGKYALDIETIEKARELTGKQAQELGK